MIEPPLHPDLIPDADAEFFDDLRVPPSPADEGLDEFGALFSVDVGELVQDLAGHVVFGDFGQYVSEAQADAHIEVDVDHAFVSHVLARSPGSTGQPSSLTL
ncbi:MAG TPA: hypothetical protein QGG37_08285 [Chloroflexota bacterium]|nr:hypothetical protein [Chloroflexota bacterium]